MGVRFDRVGVNYGRSIIFLVLILIGYSNKLSLSIHENSQISEKMIQKHYNPIALDNEKIEF